MEFVNVATRHKHFDNRLIKPLLMSAWSSVLDEYQWVDGSYLHPANSVFILL